MAKQDNITRARAIISHYAPTFEIPADFDGRLVNAVEDLAIHNDGTDTQDALNAIPENAIVYFPAGTYTVRGFSEASLNDGFNLMDGVVCIFEDAAILTIAPNNAIGYAIIFIGDTRQAVLIHPQIVGDRLAHDYTYVANNLFGDKSEWFGQSHELGHGIYLEGPGQCDIYYPEIIDVTGDCLDTRGTAGSRLRVWGGSFKNARRNNLSLESIDQFLIEDTEITGAGGTKDIFINDGGTSPKSGIDIEPYNDTHILSDITFRNVYCHDNYDAGLKSSYLYDAQVGRIFFDNCTFDGIKIISTDYPGQADDDYQVKFHNTLVADGAYGICFEAAAAHIHFTGKTIIDICDRKIGEVKRVDSAIEMRKPVWENEYYAGIKPGGIKIDDLEIRDNTSTGIDDVHLSNNIDNEFNVDDMYAPYGFQEIAVNITSTNAQGFVVVDEEPDDITYDEIQVTRPLVSPALPQDSLALDQLFLDGENFMRSRRSSKAAVAINPAIRRQLPELTGRNLLIRQYLQPGWIYEGTYEEDSEGNDRVTHFIDIEGGSAVTVTLYENLPADIDDESYVEVYDSGFSFMAILGSPSRSAGSVTYKLPEGAKYLRANLVLADVYPYKIEVGEQSTGWQLAPEDAAH